MNYQPVGQVVHEFHNVKYKVSASITDTGRSMPYIVFITHNNTHIRYSNNSYEIVRSFVARRIKRFRDKEIDNNII